MVNPAVYSKATQTFQPPAATPTTQKTPRGTVTATPESTQNTMGVSQSTTVIGAQTAGKIKTVFVIMMENHNWSDIQNNPSAPYINQTLLPQASYALQYFNPPGNHPSEPNYLWLEAGTSFGVSNDDSPDANHQSTTDHLVTYLNKAGFTWKAYQEGISGNVCPLTDAKFYSPKHNPMVFFDDVTNSNDPKSGYCIAHERPYNELQTDLQNNTQAQYNFITPNLCNDMHGADGCPSNDAIKNGDNWLSKQIPMIMGSEAYKQGGVIFIIWDESENGDNPIGMIVLSPFAKGGGYTNTIHYTHSSTLRTVEVIFNLTPWLGDSAKATDLSDLFSQFP
jgi:phosphatidylinositol-3-phosphatase